MKAVSKCLVAVLALMVVSSVIAEGSDHEIAWYGRIKGQRPDTASRIWLMERDGSNPTYVYETCGWSYPSWSPNGGSLVILQEGYRDVEGYDGVVRLDLTEPPTEPPAPCPEYFPPRVVNGHGTIMAGADAPFAYLDSLAYLSTHMAKWSPGGGEIALLVDGWVLYPNGTEGSNAIVGADPEDLCNPECQSVSPIYHADHQNIWSFDWSSDGTQLVILYDAPDGGGGIQVELAIINREDGSVALGPWIVEQVTLPGAHDMDHPAWAPTVPEGYVGPVIAFDALVPVSKNKSQVRIHLLDLGVEDPMAEEIVDGWRASWSPDSEFLAVEIWNENPQSFEFATGTVSDLGDFWFARSPTWKPAVSTVCGDGACEGAENRCNCANDCGGLPPLTEESLCTDFVDNDCDADVDCDDSDCLSDPICAVPYCGDGTCDQNESPCDCVDDCGSAPVSEAVCNDGADEDCDGLIDCDDPDCTDDASCVGGLPGDPCTSGDDCASGLCHPKKHVCR